MRFKSESLLWPDQLNTLQSMANATRAQLKTALKLRDSQLTSLRAIQACFDTKAIEKARLAAKGIFPSATNAPGQSNPVVQLDASQQMPYMLSFSSAEALSALKNKVKPEDLSGLLHSALDVALTQKLATKDIKKLVEWVISGKPASDFDPAQKPRKQPNTLLPSADMALGQPKLVAQPEASQQVKTSGKSNIDLEKLGQLLEKRKMEKIRGNETTALENLEAYIQKIASQLSAPISDSSFKGKKKGTSEEGFSESIVLDWLADISVIKQIKAKRKKKKPVSAGEWTLLAVHKFFELWGHLAKIILKLFKPFLKLLHWAWKMVIEALKELGLYKYVKAIFTIVVLIAAIWFAWEAFHYGVMRPVEMVWSKIHFRHDAEESSAPVPSPSASSPTPAPQTPISLGLGQQKRVSRPVVETQAYQPSESFQPTAYDPHYFQSEIDALPPNSIVKDFPLAPDEGMPGDLAVSRLQDLTNADKYTMKIGHGTQKILSVNPTTTTLTINYKSTDILGVFGDGSGQMNFFWEDVQVIHVDEIDVETKTGTANGNNNGPLAQSNLAPQLEASAQMQPLYQFTFIVTGAKQPFTVQCSTQADLKHIISSFEYWIRASRAAHDAPLAGMPYPTQGLRLNNDDSISTIWANSPADKAGLNLGDVAWSIDQISSVQQSRGDIEKGLESPSPILFTATLAEWKKAKTNKNSGMTNSINPKLRKITLGQ